MYNKIQLYKKNIIDSLLENKFLYFYLFCLFILMSIATLKSYFNFGFEIMDYGIESQVVHNTARGRFFQSSYEVTNYLGDHFSPLLILVSIIYFFIPFSFTPLLVQNLFFVIGLFGVFKMIKFKTKNSVVAGLLLLIFSFYEPAVSFIMYHYHPIVLAFPFLIWGLFYLFDLKKVKEGVILLFIAMLAKEDVGLTVGTILIFYSIINKSKSTFFYGLFGYLWSFMAIKFFIPYFRFGVQQDSVDKYTYIGNDLGSIISNLTSGFTLWEKMFFTQPKIAYLLKLFSPFMFIPLLTNKFVILIPSLLVNLLSKPGDPMVNVSSHYDVITSALIIYLAAEGFCNLQKLISKVLSNVSVSYKNSELTFFNRYLIIFIFILILINIPQFLENRFVTSITKKTDNYPMYKELSRIKKYIPEDAFVMPDQFSGAYLANYPNVKCLPGTCFEKDSVKINELDYIIFNRNAMEYLGGYKQYLQENKEKLTVRYEGEFFVLYKTIYSDI
jgi:uncharacterized membrane protein